MDYLRLNADAFRSLPNIVGPITQVRRVLCQLREIIFERNTAFRVILGLETFTAKRSITCSYKPWES